ncbi:MAG: pyruvate dehydrogenase (acetyl-transferring), homodimeric type, partial [Gammaproteobacteria bacterium]
NENYVHPAIPHGVEEGILKGMYPLTIGGRGKVRVQLMGSGTILREVEEAASILEGDFDIPADIWSVTSFSELRRDALETQRWNNRHPASTPRTSFVEQCLGGKDGPFVAATDYMKIVPDQIRQWVPGRFAVLGTDGYGRSDSRKALRQHFEVDSHSIVVEALKALADDGMLNPETVVAAINKFGLEPDKPDPVTL